MVLTCTNLVGFGARKQTEAAGGVTRRAIIIEDEDGANTGSGLQRTFSTGSGNNQYTFQAWIQWNNQSAANDFFTFWASDLGAEQVMNTAFGGNDMRARTGGGSGPQADSTNNQVTNNTWVHVLAQFDTSGVDTVKLFVNGTEFNNTGTFTIEATAAGEHWLGQDDGADADWPGRFFDAIFIDGALIGPTDDQSNYNSGSWKDPTNVTYGTMGYRIDGQNASDPGEDSSGNGNHFTETTASRITMTTSGLPSGA